MKVEILYFKGCPNREPLAELLRRALCFDGMDMPVCEVEVTDSEMAQKLGFLGSPSIRIDDLDIEPEARELQTFGLGCRTYTDAEGRRSGLPSIVMIRQALIEASSNDSAGSGRSA